jgi:tRNA (adenine22-N1)-methyltransferase
MKLFSLGARLALCASMVREGTALADVGTDHAYLPVWLAMRGVIRSAVAVDIRPGPLERAKQNIEKFKMGDKVTARLSDGLDEVKPEEADDIVIAGMGGEMILNIIGCAAWLRNPEKNLILQPMTKEEELRRGLLKLGFSVQQEQAVQEDYHVYTVMRCIYAPEQKQQYNALFPYIGLLTGDTPAGRAYLRREEKRLKNYIRGFEVSGDDSGASMLLEICGQLEAMLNEQQKERKQ